MGTTCTLSPQRLEERLTWIRDEILPHAQRREPLADGFAWELEAVPGLAEKLERLIALERECCGGLEFERKQGAQPGWIRLELRGVDPDTMLLDAGDTRRTRLAKAGGVGLAAACVACCAFPWTASAILGGAAAGIARIEPFFALGFGALAAVAAGWWWRTRRDPCTHHDARAGSSACR